MPAVSDDPRVARSKAAVIEATIDLLAERGVADTTVEAIAERSGVAKTTIYRHWDSKPEVVIAALGSVLEAPTDPDTGDLRQDLYRLVEALVEALSVGPWASLLPSVIDAAERDPEFARVHERFASGRHRVVRDILRRGVDRGELPADVDLEAFVEQLAGSVFYRRFIRRRPVSREHARAIVDAVLRAHGTGADDDPTSDPDPEQP